MGNGLSMPSGRISDSMGRARKALMPPPGLGGPSASQTNLLAAGRSAIGSTQPAPNALAQPAMTQAAPASPQSLPAASGQQIQNAAQQAAVAATANMSDDEIAQHAAQLEYAWHGLGNMLRAPKITHENMVDFVQGAIKAGIIPAAAARQALAKIPDDEAGLRKEVEHRLSVATHGLIAIAGIQGNRAALASGGAS